MQEEVGATGVAACGEATLRALQIISRDGATALPAGSDAIRIANRRGAEVVLASATWNAAIAAHFVARGNAEHTWNLTRRGRAMLRRLASKSALPAGKSSGRTAPSAEPRVQAAARPACNPDESPLGWLSRRRGADGAPLISPTQKEAGERLRADFTLAHLQPHLTVNWSVLGGPSSGRRGAPGAGVDMQDHVVAARSRVERALRAVGPSVSGLLLDVCCYLKGLETVERERGWPPRSARVVLGCGLADLARHYGLERSEPTRDRRPAIRHWGAEGYRPALDAPDGATG